MVSVDLDEDLVRSLSRRVVDRVAPEELPLFRLVTDAYFSQAEGKLARRRDRDEMLGFGVGEAVVLLTPIVLPVVSTVLEYLATEVATAAGARGKEAVGRLLRRLFRQTAAPDGPVPLSREQLDHVRRLAFEKARQLDLPETKAELLADSVVGSLAATE